MTSAQSGGSDETPQECLSVSLLTYESVESAFPTEAAAKRNLPSRAQEAHLVGLEPTTPGFEDQCSIQLSYKCV